MINKRDYLIKNSKKVLRKSGKRWFTVSVALLAMLGFGSLAKKAANADSVDPSDVITNWQPKTQPSNVNVQNYSNNVGSTHSSALQNGNKPSENSIDRHSSPLNNYAPAKNDNTTGSSLYGQNQKGQDVLADFNEQLNNDGISSSLNNIENRTDTPIYSFKAEQSPTDDPSITYKTRPTNINYRQDIKAPQSGVVNGKTISGNQFNDYMSKQLVQDMLNGINQERSKFGLDPVHIDPQLEQASMMRAKQSYVEYSTQPIKYIQEKNQGNNTDSDHWVHGVDDGNTIGHDAKLVGMNSLPYIPEITFQNPDKNGNMQDYTYSNMGSNAGSTSLGVSPYHDLYPSRYVVDYNYKPQDSINNDLRGMIYYDRSSDNGHTFSILNPLSDIVGIGVYYYGGMPRDNPALKGKKITVGGIHMTIEENFGSSQAMNQKLINYMDNHMSTVTSLNGHQTKASALYQPSNIVWEPSTGHEHNYFDMSHTFVKNGTRDTVYQDTPVSTDPQNNDINGWIMRDMYLKHQVTLMPTLKIATDKNRLLWGQFKIQYGNKSVLAYLPIDVAGFEKIPYPNVTNSSSDSTPSSNTPNDQPHNSTSDHSDSNQTGVNVPNSGQSSTNDTPDSGNNSDPSATVIGGGNNRNNSHQSGATNNNNNIHHDGNDSGSGGSDNNNPVSNNVAGGGSTVNNNDHGAMTSNTTNNNHASFATALGLLLGGGDNTESSNADTLAWIQDNDKDAQIARNEFQEKFDLETQLQQDTQSQDNANAIKLHAIQDSFANQERAIEARYNLQSL